MTNADKLRRAALYQAKADAATDTVARQSYQYIADKWRQLVK